MRRLLPSILVGAGLLAFAASANAGVIGITVISGSPDVTSLGGTISYNSTTHVFAASGIPVSITPPASGPLSGTTSFTLTLERFHPVGSEPTREHHRRHALAHRGQWCDDPLQQQRQPPSSASPIAPIRRPFIFFSEADRALWIREAARLESCWRRWVDFQLHDQSVYDEFRCRVHGHRRHLHLSLGRARTGQPVVGRPRKRRIALRRGPAASGLNLRFLWGLTIS